MSKRWIEEVEARGWGKSEKWLEHRPVYVKARIKSDSATTEAQTGRVQSIPQNVQETPHTRLQL